MRAERDVGYRAKCVNRAATGGYVFFLFLNLSMQIQMIPGWGRRGRVGKRRVQRGGGSGDRAGDRFAKREKSGDIWGKVRGK
jgi:hypothetical protein